MILAKPHVEPVRFRRRIGERPPNRDFARSEPVVKVTMFTLTARGEISNPPFPALGLPLGKNPKKPG